MKMKHVITAFSLSVALGLGVFAGVALHHDEVKEVKAATETVYFKDVAWWAADGAYTAVYAWDNDDDSVKNAAWPGVRMNLVSSEHATTGGNVFSYELDTSLYDKIIFVRVNGSGDIANWGAQTADLAVPTDDKTMYVATSASPVWGAPGIEGEWQTYVAPVAVTYSVKRDDSDLYEYEFANDDANKPEGTKHQFKATVPNAYRGHELVFYASGVKITSNIGVDSNSEGPIAGNNLVGNASDGFLIYHSTNSMDVYLKVYNDGGMSLWATGYAENVFYVSGSMNALTIDNDFTPADGYIKQYKSGGAINLAVKAADAGKYYICDEPGMTQDINFETAGDNNAYASNTPSGSFNVYTACSEVVYLKMKADLSLWLYIGGRVHEHVLTVGATEYAMTLVNGEYKASGVNMTAGQALNVKVDDTAVDGLAAEAIHNNNMTADMKALVNATSVDVYYKPNENVLWVGGIPADGYHILLNETTLVQMTHGEDSDGFLQWYSDSVSFAVNDTLLFVDASENRGNNLPNVFGIGKISEYGLYANFEVVSGEPAKLKCKTACTAQVYMKLKTGNDEVYFGAEPEGIDAAKAYAADFIDKIGTACNGNDPVQATLEAAWALQKTNYNALPEKAKDALKLNNSIEILNTFRAKYMRVVERRGDAGSAWAIDDFMGIAPAAPSNINIFGIRNSNNITLIIVIASAAVVSAIGLFFIIRRRKHQ